MRYWFLAAAFWKKCCQEGEEERGGDDQKKYSIGFLFLSHKFFYFIFYIQILYGLRSVFWPKYSFKKKTEIRRTIDWP